MSATTRWARSNRLRTVLGAGLATFAAAVCGLVTPSPAHAVPSHTWSSSTVCVESHVGPEWGVRGAIRNWNRLDGGPTFVMQDKCADYENTVTVRYLSEDNRYTGWTKWYWDATGHMVHADVTLNPQRIAAFPGEDRSCQRKHTTTHEFGHVLGLRHYPHKHAGSVMSYLGWKDLCGSLSEHDEADYTELYAGSSLVREPAH